LSIRDDILAVSIDLRSILTKINKHFTLKPDSIKPPDDYLGTMIRLTTLPNEIIAWGKSSSHYVQTAWLQQRRQLAKSPMDVKYRPELDITEELQPEEANYYQSLIGTLRWAIEIGRIDITTEVSMLAAHIAMPREGHLDAVLRIFAYLKRKHNSRLILDPTYPQIDFKEFQTDAN
jgi:hypothetical protein